jgi:hypothetical protein
MHRLRNFFWLTDSELFAWSECPSCEGWWRERVRDGQEDD